MTVTSTTISFTMTSQESMLQIDTGRNGNPDEELRLFIRKMTEVVRDNWDERFMPLTDDRVTPGQTYESWLHVEAQAYGEPPANEEEQQEQLISAFDRMVSFLSDADYHAFIDGDTGCFHIFDGPYLWDDNGDFNVIAEIPGGWQIQPAYENGSGYKTVPDRDAAIVAVFENINNGNFEEAPVFVEHEHNNVWRVDDYKNEQRVLVNERGNKP